MKLSIIFSMLLLLGAAGAAAGEVLNLSGVDFEKTFSQPELAKDGVARNMGSVTWGTPHGWDNKADGAPYGNLTPVPVGSNAKRAYLDSKEKANLPSHAAQVEAYLDEQLNRSSANVSPNEW